MRAAGLLNGRQVTGYRLGDFAHTQNVQSSTTVSESSVNRKVENEPSDGQR